MARKIKIPQNADGVAPFYVRAIFIFIVPVVVLIFFVENIISSGSVANITSIIVFIAYSIFMYPRIMAWFKRVKEENKRTEGIAFNIIAGHKEALGLQCLHKLRNDVYGTENTEKWEKEMNHFFDTQLSRLPHDDIPDFRQKCLFTINDVGRRERARLEEGVNSDPDMLFSPDMSGFDFEDYCGVILRKAGWEADVTKASGDQGADIIARKGGIKAVFQCKLYKKRAVGNAAVQQAHTAMLHYRADMAVVIGDTGFSESAEVLATTTQVKLLDHRQLYRWASSLGEDTKCNASSDFC